VEYRLEEGDPAKTILKAASKCDLIVMGMHGRHGIKRVLPGSVAATICARRVASLSPCVRLRGCPLITGIVSRMLRTWQASKVKTSSWGLEIVWDSHAVISELVRSWLEAM